MKLRVAWSDTGYIKDPFTLAADASNFQDHEAPVGDAITDFRVTNLYPSRTYYFSLWAADTVPNWSTWNTMLSGTVVMDTALDRPRNSLLWVIDVPEPKVNDLLVKVPYLDLIQSDQPRPLEQKDSLTEVGVWYRTFEFDTAFIDTTPPNILISIDSIANESQILESVLNPNRTYYIAASARNVFGNWGLLNTSCYVKKTTKYAPHQIEQPPISLVTGFSISYAEEYDSLNFIINLSSLTYFDTKNAMDINIDSAVIYFKEGSTPPTAVDDVGSSFLGGYIVGPSTQNFTGKFGGAGLDCNKTYTFSIFLVNTLDPSYSNRYSNHLTFSGGPVTMKCAPVTNDVVINSLTCEGGNARPCTLAVNYTWNGSYSPLKFKFLYRFTSGSSINPPAFHGDPLFSSTILDSPPATGTFRIADNGNIHPNTLYMVAVYPMNQAGIWASIPVHQTVTTQNVNDTQGPASCPITVTLTQLNVGTVQLAWDTLAGFGALMGNENSRMKIGYDFNTSGVNVYSSAHPYRYIVPTADIYSVKSRNFTSADNILPYGTYYFSVAPLDSMNNNAAAGVNSTASITVSIASVPAESILVKAVDTIGVEIDWSALLNYASLVDPYLTHAVIVITDSATGRTRTSPIAACLFRGP
jgi:hypothetical protein